MIPALVRYSARGLRLLQAMDHKFATTDLRTIHGRTPWRSPFLRSSHDKGATYHLESLHHQESFYRQNSLRDVTQSKKIEQSIAMRSSNAGQLRLAEASQTGGWQHEGDKAAVRNHKWKRNE
jgi:hypothetical protein